MLRYRCRRRQGESKEPYSVGSIETQRLGNPMDECRGDGVVLVARFERCVPSFGNADELGHVAARQTRNPTAPRALKADLLGLKSRAANSEEGP